MGTTGQEGCVPKATICPALDSLGGSWARALTVSGLAVAAADSVSAICLHMTSIYRKHPGSVCPCGGQRFALSLQILPSAQEPNELDSENPFPARRKQDLPLLLGAAPHLPV